MLAIVVNKVILKDLIVNGFPMVAVVDVLL